MRAQRIKKGFHRIGIVLVVICVVVAAANLYSGGTTGAENGVASLIVGGFLNALAYGIGWIVAGFAGDGEK